MLPYITHFEAIQITLQTDEVSCKKQTACYVNKSKLNGHICKDYIGISLHVSLGQKHTLWNQGWCDDIF